MNSDELREIIRRTEGLKLDFKREYKLGSTPPGSTSEQDWNLFVRGQWDELIKDVLALTNGNVGTAGQTGFLIIGADDELLPDGTRQTHDTSGLKLTSQQILARVNSACEPPIPDIKHEQISVDGKILQIITIPASPYFHETTRQLNITKGEFDTTGTLRSSKSETYTARTAFVRRGENIFPATDSERRTISTEKIAYLQRQVDHMELDKKLFLEIRRILPSTTVKFICEHDFGGSFVLERLSPIHEFIDLCAYPENEFFDADMTAWLSRLKGSILEFRNAIGLHTAPINATREITINRMARDPIQEPGIMEWLGRRAKDDEDLDRLVEEQRQEIARIRLELNRLAEQVCNTYAEFIRFGRRKLDV